MNHPIDVRRTLNSFGFWYTYWDLRNVGVSFRETLWLIFIAKNIK
jgi:hypothetical protein